MKNDLMRSGWFILGLLLLSLAFSWYVWADDHRYSVSSYDQYKAVDRSLTGAMVAGVFGFLICLAGIFTNEEESPKKDRTDRTPPPEPTIITEDLKTAEDQKYDYCGGTVIIEPKK